MILWKPILLAASICVYIPMQALMEEKISEKIPISVVFSKSSHNRISVDGGGIEKIFGDESYFHVSIDRSTGNAFVNVLKEIVGGPSTLTVVTHSGLVQDLYVSSGDKFSEHLVLSEDFEDEGFIGTKLNFNVYAVEILNRVLEGKTPIGYGQRLIKEDEFFQLPFPLQVEPIKAFEGVSEDLVVFIIKNLGKKPVVLSADSLKREGAAWVFLNAHELHGKQEATCIIALNKNEE